jgi:ATP-dependent Lon protease
MTLHIDSKCREMITMDNVQVNKLELPLLPLRGLSVFPYMVLHFDVGREKSILAIEEAMVKEQLIFLVSQKDPRQDEPGVDDFYHVGTVSKIKQLLKLPGDTVRVLVEGVSRGKIVSLQQREPHFRAEIEEIIYEELEEVDTETEALMRSVMDGFEEYVSLSNKVSPEVLITIGEVNQPGRLADIISSQIFLKTEEKQRVLEAFEPKERLEVIHSILSKEIEILEIEKKINIRVKKQIDKVQREYYLREQLKAIQKELGEKDGITEEVEEYHKKIEKLKLPKEVEEKVMKELDRLAKLPPGSAENGVIRTYVDWILDLPWNKQTKDSLDVKEARKILDQDHYGLKKVKERVIEYLAIRKLAKNMRGPILCLVGPPGVGKTSIAKSIAKSLNRNFGRMSLGGVRDEAEIRGHRRTYVGAIPGRIIYTLKQAGTKNPVFLLDEIDKMSSDFRGDPSAALLEVLDAEQNKDFRDHYLELPFDLSKVMFITTANSLETIPRPLLDRMEVIYVSGYTEEEKVNIGVKYLLPKQLKENGLKKENLIISEQTIRAIANNYTRESGVRSLERQIGTLCRKAAAQIVETGKRAVKVTPNNLDKYLGIPKYRHDKVKEDHEVGTVTGLAWTPFGGETLSIEVTPMQGDGKLVLTGQLGDVMKESARAGLSYIRWQSDNLGIDAEFYKNTDIHIHIPEGAIPKDGPSAGLAMASAVISALSKRAVRNDIAMTGEITLRGKALPVGGIKEKVLAANRAGIKKVLLPIDNKKDLEEIPDNVKRKLEFVLVESMEQVLEHALVKETINNEN